MPPVSVRPPLAGRPPVCVSSCHYLHFITHRYRSAISRAAGDAGSVSWAVRPSVNALAWAIRAPRVTGARPRPNPRTASTASATHGPRGGQALSTATASAIPMAASVAGIRRQVDRGRPARDQHQVREPGRFRSAARLPGRRVDHHQGRAGIGRGLDHHPGQPGRVRRDHRRGDAIPEPSPHRRRSLRVQVDHRRLSAGALMGHREGKGEGRFPASALLRYQRQRAYHGKHARALLSVKSIAAAAAWHRPPPQAGRESWR